MIHDTKRKIDFHQRLVFVDLLFQLSTQFLDQLETTAIACKRGHTRKGRHYHDQDQNELIIQVGTGDLVLQVLFRGTYDSPNYSKITFGLVIIEWVLLGDWGELLF